MHINLNYYLHLAPHPRRELALVALEDGLPLPGPAAAAGVEQAVLPLQLLVDRRVLLLQMTVI